MFFGVQDNPYIKAFGISYGSLENLFAQLSSLSIGGLEISYPGDHRDVVWLDYCRILSELSDKFPIKVSMHAPARDISSTNEETRVEAVEIVGEAIDSFGAVIGKGTVVVHPEDTTLIKPFKAKKRKDNCTRSLESLCERASQREIRIALENMRWRRDKPERTGMHLSEVSEIIRKLDEKSVGICFDVGHASISEGESLYPALKASIGRVIHVHLNDNHGYHGEDEHLELGEGTIDLERFVSVLKSAEYEDAVILEVSQMRTRDDPIQFYKRNVKKFTCSLLRTRDQ